jgi:hypothetical protein
MVSLLRSLLCLCFLGLNSATTLGASQIGVRLLVQPWNPQTDDDTPIVAIDNPTLISDALAQVWSEKGDDLRDSLVSVLGTPNMIADGVTFYEIRLGIPQPTLSLEPISGGSSEPLVMRARFDLPRVTLGLTTTTPDIFGSWADPRCSAVADVALTVELSLGGQDTAHLVGLSGAENPVRITISNFTWDSENFPCDVVKAVVGLLGAQTLIKREVENPERTKPFATTLAQVTTSALDLANQAVYAAVPDGLVQLGFWLRGMPDRNQLVAAYVGLRSPIADPSPGASITGFIRRADGKSTAGLRCDDLPILAERTAGPRRVLNEMGALGDEVRAPLATSTECGEVLPDGSRSFTMRGLSSGFRNYFIQTGLEGLGCNDEGVMFDTAWPENAGVPTTFNQPYNMMLRTISGACYDLFFERTEEVPHAPGGPVEVRPIDPTINLQKRLQRIQVLTLG